MRYTKCVHDYSQCSDGRKVAFSRNDLANRARPNCSAVVPNKAVTVRERLPGAGRLIHQLTMLDENARFRSVVFSKTVCYKMLQSPAKSYKRYRG